MAPDPHRQQRRSLRLPDYDYRRDGFYFVTICVDDREPRLGQVVDGRVALTEAGRMVDAHWRALPNRFANVALDAYVVMPDHVHGILKIVGAPLVGAPDGTVTNTGAATRAAPTSFEQPSLGDVIGAFKSRTTNAYIHGVRHHDWPPFDRRLWQRNYYERVIRNEAELAPIRDYIRTNPRRARLAD